MTVFRVWINASPQKVWDAIVDPAFNQRYGYGLPSEYDLRPGGLFLVRQPEAMVKLGAPAVMIDGEVLELDPPKRLVQTWHANFTEQTAAEPPQRVTYELEEEGEGIVILTVTHELDAAPATARFVQGDEEMGGKGGLPMILSDMKTWLETGKSMRLPS
ncbi:MAG TPA: SRPBCC family protein [Mycobacteriales bacterium]|nr:SRPBCC family protein [Mycobacteriales bacterium]